MNVSFTENAWEDYLYWQKMDKKIVKRINELIKDIKRSPFEGVGNQNHQSMIWLESGVEE